MSWRLAVVGSPIAHSLSPALHEAGLRALGLSGSSRALDVSDREGLLAVIGDHDAVSVTMPLKEIAAGCCDQMDAAARRTGVVNSLLMTRRRPEGRCTDGAGLLASLHEDFHLDVSARTCVVLGSGASAAAIVDALSHAGASSIAIVARNERAAGVIASGNQGAAVNPAHVDRVALVVNTTPQGAHRGSQLPSVPVMLDDDAVAVDITYDPPESTWLLEQRHAGARTTNGRSMLVHQARLQMQWWFDCEVPLAALVAAVAP